MFVVMVAIFKLDGLGLSHVTLLVFLLFCFNILYCSQFCVYVKSNFTSRFVFDILIWRVFVDKLGMTVNDLQNAVMMKMSNTA